MVTRVVDGDTFWLRGLAAGPVPAGHAVRVRVIGLDAPELDPPECWGERALAHARMVLPPGTQVRVRTGPERTDRFGRLLLHVLLRDGTSYAVEAVRAGHGVAFRNQPDRDLAHRLHAAEQEARRARRGLWGRCATAAAFHRPVGDR